MSGPRPGTISNDLLPVLVSTLPNRSALEAVVRAALAGDTVRIAVDEQPEPGVRYALELTCPGQRTPVSVLAELAPGGALQVRPQGQQGAAELRQYLGDRSSLLEIEPDEELDPFVGRLLGGGKYEIESLISSGSAGLVYRARHLLLDRPIAIKVLHADLTHDPMFTAHFNGEARAASRLDHPNICRVFDFGQDDDGLLYIVMELLEGRELGEIVHRAGPLPVGRIVDYMVQVCAALSLAHERGIVHRDVKSENILACPATDDDGVAIEVVKVCDFGLAMSTDLRAEQFATHRGACGTPQYMPPEQVRGEALDARADIYACGVLMYLLATGRLPFDDDDPRRICSMQLKSTPVAPSTLNPNIDPTLEALIQRSMSKDRNGRPSNARELRQALRALKPGDQPVHSSPGRSSGQTPTDANGPVSTRQVESVRFGIPALRTTPQSAPRPLALVVDAFNQAMAREGADTELAQALNGLLQNRVQVCFFRADASRPDLLAQDGASEPRPLLDGCPAPAAQQFAAALAQRTIISLTLREGIDYQEVVQFAAKLRAKRATSAALPHVTIVADHARLGRHRALSWPLDLAATQTAFVLAMQEPDAVKRGTALAAAMRVVRSPADARVLLENSDLVAASTNVSAWDVACAIGGSIPQVVCGQLLSILASELLNRTSAVPIDMIRMLARRLSVDRTPNTDELLRNLFARSLIAAEDVPEELRVERRADQRAEEILASPVRALAVLEAATDAHTYTYELGVIAEALRLLLKHGRLVAFAECFRVLAQHARDGAHPFRMGPAKRAVEQLQDATFLERLALVLLRGPQASHEAAQTVLVATEEAGAQALCTVRVRAGRELDMGGRKRFANALRLCGAPAAPALSRTLSRIELSDATLPVVEDILRAVPDRAGGELASSVLQLTQHPAPQLRRAALGALVATAGPRARPTLVAALSDKDEGVVLSALVAVQRLGGLEGPAVARLEELLSGASDEIRVAAAEALQGAGISARPEAIAALMRVAAGKGISRVFRLGDDHESVAVTEAVARSLLKIGGRDGRRAVEQRAERASGELKQRLALLLTNA